jgi:glycine/D-amino acid oxidase-like deaminating enzyme
MYPEYVDQLEDESGTKIDLRENGTILFPSSEHANDSTLFSKYPLPAPLAELDPNLATRDRGALFLHESSVDPRALVAAAIKAARHREIDTSAADAVTGVDVQRGQVTGVTTRKTSFSAPVVVNCAGAWACQLGDHSFPTRPVKGQMLAVAGQKNLLRHVVRAPEAYIIPRSDGRIVIGTTVEETGYDKRTDPDTIQRLLHGAISLFPKLKNAKILADWAGLRPGTPDGLPILGATLTEGYFVATGHFRDGILLAPITARLVGQLICGELSECDITPFSPARFMNRHS